MRREREKEGERGREGGREGRREGRREREGEGGRGDKRRKGRVPLNTDTDNGSC